MNETKYIFIVHSDIDENNIYAEFETEEEAIAYAKRNADELTYVDKVAVTLDEDGDILEMFDSETIWSWEEAQMIESINLRNKAEQDEFFRLCKECGFVTMGDLENFKVSAGIKDEDLLQALRDYKNSITQNEFDVFQDEVECQNCGEVKRGRRTDGGYYVCDNCVEEDLDSLVEKMEESEDMVECKECFELFPKQDGFKIEVGYVCPHCHASQFAVADEDTFKVDFPEYERVADLDDFVDYHTDETAAPEMPAEPIVEVSAESVEGILKALVKDEEEAIAAYDQAKDAIVANEELPEKDKKEIVDTIEHIKEEEIEHIEELEELDSAEEVENENDPISTEEETEPLNESISELTPKQLAEIDAYLRSGKDLQLEDFEEEHSDFSIDLVGGDLTYNRKTNDFTFYLSIYHASEDNNANNPERHTDEEEISFDTIEEVYDEFPHYLEDIYKWNASKFSKLEEAVKCTDCGGELKDNKCTSCDRDFNLAKCKYCGGVVKDGKCMHCDTKAEPVEEAIGDSHRPIIEKLPKITKEEFQELLTPGRTIEIFGGDPREPGIRSRNYEVTYYDGKYEVSYWEENYNDDFLDSEHYETFDSMDELWDFMVDFMKDDDYVPNYNYLAEHINEEHPAIESDQKLVGTDNAVVDCKVNKVITHSEDEKPVDCKGEKKPLKKPLTEEVTTELTEKEFAQMEAYLKGGKYRSLDTEWTDEGKEGNFYVDECSAYLSYNHNTNKFELGLSTYHASDDNNAEYPEYHTEEEDYSYDSLAEMYDDGAFTQILDWLYEENIDKIIKVLSEETHAQYAKPEGNRVQAYNNALKYAKKNNCDYIYGYTNHTGKFFALEQPLKAKDSDAEEQFRKQYKNCKVVYMVYPDKAFLQESLYNFTPEEMEEYGCDEEGCSVEGWDTFVRCNWCKEVYTEYECVFEANLGWLCPRCQEEIRYHGGPLTIKEYPSEDDIRRTLTEEKENPNEKVEQEDTASVAGMDFEAACKQFGIE